MFPKDRPVKVDDFRHDNFRIEPESQVPFVLSPKSESDVPTSLLPTYETYLVYFIDKVNNTGHV